jgi:muramoyltetrapeptide carboxypeptidase
VVGFSDATALFAYLHAAAGISVLHAPCLAAPAFLNTPPQQAELEALRRALFDPAWEADYPVTPLHRPPGSPGRITGRLVGGCLAVLTTTLGTPWEVDTRDAILFLEDVNEAPYQIDRMVTHLRTAGKLDAVRGLVIGHLQGCEDDPPGLLDEVLRDLFADAPFPVATGLPAGHGSPNLPLPLGQQARLELPPGPAPQGKGRLTAK